MRSAARVRYAAASSGQSAADDRRPGRGTRAGEQRQRLDRDVVGHRLQTGSQGDLTLLFGLPVGQRLPQPPVDRGGRQPGGPAGQREGVQERGGRGVVRQPAGPGQTGDRREQHELLDLVPQRKPVQQRHHVQLGPEHRGDVVVGHVQQRDRPTAECGHVDAGQRRQVRAEAVEHRAHRGFVRRVGGGRHQRGAGRSPGGRPDRRGVNRGCATPRRPCPHPSRPVAGSGAARCFRSRR